MKEKQQLQAETQAKTDFVPLGAAGGGTEFSGITAREAKLLGLIPKQLSDKGPGPNGGGVRRGHTIDILNGVGRDATLGIVCTTVGNKIFLSRPRKSQALLLYFTVIKFNVYQYGTKGAFFR